MSLKTEQEKFWEGEFGDAYVDRNNEPESIASRTAVFSKIIRNTKNISSVLEFGANIGQNLLALRNLKPSCLFGAVEINTKAIETLKKISDTNVFEGSIFDFSQEELGKYDLTFTSGVLIHINPERLQDVYSRLFNCSNNFILVKEYYNPTPVEVNYRGHSERLFKRDFAGDMIDLYPELELIDYGFQYHRDCNFPMDDSTWFLLKKKG